ncbi:hypothetical protein [Aliiglaciecola litoralis]|uniref:Uncharacterized protein n=1 Tax=Aliiglaciecola litoralis TaxID=582857 RepID=A0ABP3WWR3_9ALTE
MTSFADPEIIACPHCDQRYLRRVFRSLSLFRELTFSDGGSIGLLSSLKEHACRCDNCNNIIKDYTKLPTLGIRTKPTFWQRWFSEPVNYDYTPRVTLSVFLELYLQSKDTNEKRNWAIKALRLINRTHKMDGHESALTPKLQDTYDNISQFILDNPITPVVDEYWLICADIHRLRGHFEMAKACYAKVCDQELTPFVEQGTRWCDDGNTSLMVVEFPESEW